MKDFWILKSNASRINISIQILLEVMEGTLKTQQNHILIKVLHYVAFR